MTNFAWLLRTGPTVLPVPQLVCDFRTKPVIGLAGGIGAGKSTVAGELERLGAAILDFDRLAHEELDSPDAKAAVRQWWGDSILASDDSVDRARVAAIVFENADELARLEGLLYPRLTQSCRDTISDLQKAKNVLAIVLDAPKLLEAKLDELCDAVIFVDCARETRLDRVKQSRGWGASELDRREKLQNPLDTKKSRADYIVINYGGIEHLRPQVVRVFKSVLSSFTKVSGG